ncbi:hypothetical protein, unlikely [Trypanosoma brucei gambiense DAL972]|uniref:Uncharacterized protein n=1 Tax=Trypanosoma brucei gambiense (strain MHOM/CI/86/DAL972) TaxID=679716 RepID=D0A5B6_TRYB9|nr:hypothetical protein, unlikely [Trypanosoma brucei gambiense DAL972]CBH16460.1 hypothetical protein, unlikely [Trypanosoma brucei gambiense DAL972]|eukprot:XP_011778724.1 hypothetical protein, unlikely [Trypanosoma brucei gambiense DAL972]
MGRSNEVGPLLALSPIAHLSFRYSRSLFYLLPQRSFFFRWPSKQNAHCARVWEPWSNNRNTHTRSTRQPNKARGGDNYHLTGGSSNTSHFITSNRDYGITPPKPIPT